MAHGEGYEHEIMEGKLSRRLWQLLLLFSLLRKLGLIRLHQPAQMDIVLLPLSLQPVEPATFLSLTEEREVPALQKDVSSSGKKTFESCNKVYSLSKKAVPGQV